MTQLYIKIIPKEKKIRSNKLPVVTNCLELMTASPTPAIKQKPHTYSLRGLEAKSTKICSFGPNQGVSYDIYPPEDPGENLPFFFHFLCAASFPWLLPASLQSLRPSSSNLCSICPLHFPLSVKSLSPS